MKKCRQELFVKGSEMFTLLGDFYTLNKLIMNGDANGIRSDEYWVKSIQLANEFCHKYENTKNYDYARKLALTLMEELERRDKEEHTAKVAVG